jgi:hypothetical protein
MSRAAIQLEKSVKLIRKLMKKDTDCNALVVIVDVSFDAK